jgi:2-succinyl-5-enolpyruvyl-6-hydroxy-3-cyclohexene-1-carboxylate synthase
VDGNRIQDFRTQGRRSNKMTSDKHIAQWTIEALLHLGVKDVVCSPGSRNAPLLIALANSSLEMHTVGDERSAAFQALGRSLGTNRPVALCCTSGSALSNYYPAVLEAYYSHVPLVVITADRPAQRVNKGEGQTCVQPGFFEPHIGWSISFQEDARTEEVSRQWSIAQQKVLVERLPVHINVAFEEPLYGQAQAVAPLKWTTPGEKIPSKPVALPKMPTALVFGQLLPSEQKNISAMLDAAAEDVRVFADPTSGLLWHPKALSMRDLEKYPFQLLVSVGGQWIDKRPKHYVRSVKELTHIHVDAHQCWDVSDANPIHVPLNFSEWELAQEAFTQTVAVGSKKAIPWSSLPWSDAKVIGCAMEVLEPSSVLHFGNSTAVRFLDYFPSKGPLYSNRGIAGIDGSLSTAVGLAISQPTESHYCFLGDQSFIYDSNGLFYHELPTNLCVVVLNNRRGAIFDWLPGTSTSPTRAQAVFANEHKVDIGALARAFGANHVQVEGVEEFQKHLKEKSTKTKVIEVLTDRSNNEAALNWLKSEG